MIADPQFWSRLFVTLALETAGVVAVGWFITRFLRSASACRFVWRAVMIGLMLVCVSDLSGLGLVAVNGLSRQNEETPKQQFVFERRFDGALAQPVHFVPYAAPVPAFQRIDSWPGWLWAIGCAAVLARVLTAHGLLMVLRRLRRRVTDEVVNEEARGTALRFALRRHVVLIEASEVAAPFAFGIFRPVIALPAQFATKFQPAEREAILAHEMAHIAADDPAWQLVANVASALFWWHPAVWLARRWLYDAAEMAADESVSMLENGPQTLAECLVAMARTVVSPLWWGGVGMNGPQRHSNLRRRVERLLELRAGDVFGVSVRQRSLRFAAAAVLLFGAFLLSGFVQEKSTAGIGDTDETWRKAPLSIIWRNIVNTPRAVSLKDQLLINAKVAYDTGNYPLAKSELQLVLSMEPTNQAAQYYMGLIREGTRHVKNWNQPWLLPTFPPKAVPMGATGVATVNSAPQPVPTAGSTSADSTNLYSKQFHLDENTLIQTLRGEGYAVSDPKKIHQSFKDWFKAKGIDLSAPSKSVFYNDRNGLLLVRGTLSDLEYIELAIQTMGKVPSQLTIESQIAQISGDPDKLLKRLGVDLKVPQVWSWDSYRKLIESLKSEPGVDVLSTPKVTTLSERTAYVETADELADGRKTGIAVTFLPKISTDTFVIDLTVIYARGTTKDKNSRLPAQGEAHATVPDHSTLVFVCNDSESPGKKDLVLVTPTVIDPVGNMVHSNEEMKNRAVNQP